MRVRVSLWKVFLCRLWCGRNTNSYCCQSRETGSSVFGERWANARRKQPSKAATVADNASVKNKLNPVTIPWRLHGLILHTRTSQHDGCVPTHIFSHICCTQKWRVGGKRTLSSEDASSASICWMRNLSKVSKWPLQDHFSSSVASSLTWSGVTLRDEAWGPSPTSILSVPENKTTNKLNWTNRMILMFQVGSVTLKTTLSSYYCKMSIFNQD